MPQINSFKVIPPYGHNSHRMHVPSFQNNTTATHQNAKVNKAYDYKYFYSYKVVKGCENISHFHNQMVIKLKPSLNIKNVNYQYAVPSYSPTHYVPEFGVAYQHHEYKSGTKFTRYDKYLLF